MNTPVFHHQDGSIIHFEEGPISDEEIDNLTKWYKDQPTTQTSVDFFDALNSLEQYQRQLFHG